MDDLRRSLDGALNFREIGGLRTEDGRRVRRGVLFRSDTLQFLTDDGVRVVAEEIGVRTVIDLRLPYEVEIEGRGLLAEMPHRYLRLPFLVEGARQEGSAVPRLSGEDPVVRHYLGYLTTSPEAVTGVVAALAADDALPAIVHCTAGKDRTGVAIAVVLAAVGVRRDEIVADYAAASDQMSAVWERLRTLPTYGPRLDSMPPESALTEPGFMERFLAVVDERYGGVQAYLKAHGVDQRTLAALRNRLTEHDA